MSFRLSHKTKSSIDKKHIVKGMLEGLQVLLIIIKWIRLYQLQSEPKNWRGRAIQVRTSTTARPKLIIDGV